MAVNWKWGAEVKKKGSEGLTQGISFALLSKTIYGKENVRHNPHRVGDRGPDTRCHQLPERRKQYTKRQGNNRLRHRGTHLFLRRHRTFTNHEGQGSLSIVEFRTQTTIDTCRKDPALLSCAKK